MTEAEDPERFGDANRPEGRGFGIDPADLPPDRRPAQGGHSGGMGEETDWAAAWHGGNRAGFAIASDHRPFLEEFQSWLSILTK